MQGGSRLKGRFAARFHDGDSTDGKVEEDDDISVVVVEQDHFQLTCEQISNSPLAVIESQAPTFEIVDTVYMSKVNEGKAN